MKGSPRLRRGARGYKGKVFMKAERLNPIGMKCSKLTTQWG